MSDVSGDGGQTVNNGSTKVKVYVWTDFVCPFCLIGEGPISEAVKAENAELVWMPFELRPHPTPALRPEDDYLQNAWRDNVYPTAERFGIPMTLPTVSPQPHTRVPFIGMQWAADQGKRSEYVEAVLRAFFQDDRDIGDVTVLRALVGDLGLDPDAFEAALSDPEYARRHDEALALAGQVGVRAVPTALIGDRLFSGMRDVDAMRKAIRETTTNLLEYPQRAA